jgi:putative IMPACT (imprinted ancient) family translation regulator
VTFSDLALVKARLASTVGVQIRQESFAETGATLVVDLPEVSAPQIIRLILDVTSGRALVLMDP